MSTRTLKSLGTAVLRRLTPITARMTLHGPATRGLRALSEGLDLIARTPQPVLDLLIEPTRIRWLNVPAGAQPILAGGVDRLSSEIGRFRLTAPRFSHDTRAAYPLQGGPVLTRTLTLPLAARPHLREIIRHQISRRTPYRAEHVSFDHEVLETSRERNEVTVRLCVVPLTTVSALADTFRDAGLALTRIGLRDTETDAPIGINLLPPEMRARPRRKPGDRVTRLFTLLHLTAPACVLAGALGIATILTMRMEDRLANVQDEARSVIALRQDIAALSASTNRLRGLQARSPSPVLLLEDLSTLLPDGTWLERMDLEPGRLRLTGESRDASALLGLLDRDPRFSDVTFLSPVTARNNVERFQIEARITQPAAGGQS